MEMQVEADGQINADRVGMKVQAGESIRRRKSSYQVAGSQPDRSADVGELPGLSMAEVFLSDWCGVLSWGLRTLSDE
jgi:hypothetical protein